MKTKDYSLISGLQLWLLTITATGPTSGSPGVRKTDQSDIIERYRLVSFLQPVGKVNKKPLLVLATACQHTFGLLKGL